jgi:putative FmdB family regulatory protein
MPIYEYYCKDCSATFELLRPKRQADERAVCKKCNGASTTRTISVFAAHSGGRALAGSGGGCAGCTPSAGCAGCSGR